VRSADLLAVRDLCTDLDGVRIVDGVSLSIAPGEMLGLAGESGCGKSMLSLSILQLLPPGAVVTAGQAVFDGLDLVGLASPALQAIRGRRVAMVFQEPMSSLHPTLRIADQIVGVLRAHHPSASRRELRRRALAALARARMPDPAAAARAYPHELSGGLCQRVLIAMAIAGEPDLLIADEPTTALDATVAADILDLLDDLRRAKEPRGRGLAVLLITHDLKLLARRADRIAVMYAGRIVEQARASSLFDHPQHPYTRALLAGMPSLSGPRPAHLAAIPGGVPAPGAWPDGCRFRPRCGFAIAACATVDPPLHEIAPGHLAACIRAPL
jgi:peptide/nickel transport system ATP-binding protein/oligopeptide transport system ATP-binding protein